MRTLAEGKIKPEEMPIPADTRKDLIRYAPGFGRGPAAGPRVPYTVDALANFLNDVDKDGKASEIFNATFAALELIEEGWIKKEDVEEIKNSGHEALAARVRVARGHRDAALKEAERVKQQAEIR